MSRLLLSIEAQDCNAWASDLVHGIPSPLSLALYLRAIFCENADLGFGTPSCFVLALRSVGHDRGSYSSRPLLTYIDPEKASGSADPTPLFDEHRCSLHVQLLVHTTQDPALAAQPGQEQAALRELERRLRFFRFLGGNVLAAGVQPAGSVDHVVRHLHGSRIYIDETAAVLQHSDDSLQALRAALLANLDEHVQAAASARWAIPQRLWEAVNGRWLRVMPLAYRRLSPLVHRPDARFVLDSARKPKPALHAFVESAYGFVELLGPARAFDRNAMRNLWWSAAHPDSAPSALAYSVQGTSHHE